MHEDCWRQVVIPDGIGEYVTDPPGARITGLSRLNAFIGPNNSGKSRLLRALFKTRCKFVCGQQSQDEVISAISALRELAPRLPPDGPLNRLRKLIDEVSPLTRSAEGGSVSTTLNGERFREFSDPNSPTLSAADAETIKQSARTLNVRLPESFQNLPPIPATAVYIPLLRGLRSPVKDPPYWLERTNSDYFAGKEFQGLDLEQPSGDNENKAFVVTGHEYFDLFTHHLLGDRAQREMVRSFESFLSERFFDGTDIGLIPPHKNKSTRILAVKIGKAKERPIHELGDGIQQLIVMTFPLFLFPKRNLQLFIEEPELAIHPGYQRLLINAFLDDKDRRLQVFVATHSHQFMDITIDSDECSVFKIRRRLDGKDDEQEHKESFEVIRSSTSDFDTLRILGVRNSSVLLSNCTIWVEGVTDRRYLRRYLEIVQSRDGTRLREDIEFSFVEYSGGNITHWSFLDDEEGIEVTRVCAPVYVLIDGDYDSDQCGSKDKREGKLRATLGEDSMSRLSVNEIENLLRPEVLQKVVSDYEGECEFKQFCHADYAKKYLGAFIEKSMIEGTLKRKAPRTNRPYAETSGTLKDKSEFCTRALKYINTIEDMSLYAIDLTQHILAFIQSHNQLRK